jgi:hypothetical protein
MEYEMAWAGWKNRGRARKLLQRDLSPAARAPKKLIVKERHRAMLVTIRPNERNAAAARIYAEWKPAMITSDSGHFIHAGIPEDGKTRLAMA